MRLSSTLGAALPFGSKASRPRVESGRLLEGNSIVGRFGTESHSYHRTLAVVIAEAET